MSGGLVASTLPVKSDDLFMRGILADNPVGLPPPAAFVAPTTGTAGAVTVNSGATLKTSDGGRIVLLGSAVTNNGSIATPEGQTILGAATNNVYLAASSNPDMRGLLIAVDSSGLAGAVTNSGQITADHGNITLAGLVVNQKGVLSATTSVSANGSIYLIAGDAPPDKPYFVRNTTGSFGGLMPGEGGTLVLAPGSVTEVLPDAKDTATLTVPQLQGFIPSEIDLAGKDVSLVGNATIHAPSGHVNMYASANPQALLRSPNQPEADGGTIYVDHASVIDVAGLRDVSASVTDNILQVTLESIDLQNDPLLRNGFLHGAKVTVDAGRGSRLFDVTPYANNIGSNISEISTRGGSINMFATGDVVVRSGSKLDVSGGSIAFAGGYADATTNLIGADGKVYNIATAPNNVQYVGYANSYGYVDPTWGTTNHGTGQVYYSGYTQGKDAGSISVQASQAYLRGNMLAQTVSGQFQLTPDTMPAGGSLVLGCAGCLTSSRVANFGFDGGVSFADPLHDTLAVTTGALGQPILSGSLPTVSELSPAQLASGGFSTLQVFSNGSIWLPRAASLDLGNNGNLTLRSATAVNVDGNITAHGGSVLLQTANTGDALKHDIHIGTGAVVDVSGTWTNDSPLATNQPGHTPIVLNGGSVTASAAGDLVLASGSLIDVSGGGAVDTANKISEGNAGSIALSANFNTAPGFAPFTGALQLAQDARLMGASLKSNGGGSLALQSGSVVVGTATGAAGELVLDPALFAEGGFSRYKVTGQNSVMIGNPNAPSGSAPLVVAPIQATRVFTASALNQVTGTKLSAFTQLHALPLAQRSPASISFIANASTVQPGVETGDVTLAANASIVTDPQGSVLLAANGYNGNVYVFGKIAAPAGNITLQLTDPASPLYGGGDAGFIPVQRIQLGSQAVLNAAGYAKIDTLDAAGYREGSVLGGGTVSLLANKGFIQTYQGSMINVDGAAGVLDIVGNGAVVPTTVGASAGTVNLYAREGLVLQGSLSGNAAVLNGAPLSGAAGGSLNVGLGNGFSNAGPNGVTALNAVSTAQYPDNERVLTLVGDAPNDGGPNGALKSGVARLDAAQLTSGGFDSLSLRSADRIVSDGKVDMRAAASLTLDAPILQATAGSSLSLSAAYVALGNQYNNVDYFDANDGSPNATSVLHPSGGTGTLAVKAQQIDVRGISALDGFGRAHLASNGDIRFVSALNPDTAPPALGVPGDASFEGALELAGTLTLSAARIYPTTATGFVINDLPTSSAAGAPNGTTVNIDTAGAHGSNAAPLSAAGSLTINANVVNQDGVLRAPFGALALNGVSLLDSSGDLLAQGQVNLGAGSLTSVSSDGMLIPYGSTANGTQWTFSPFPDLTTVISQLPAKRISLTGSSVDIAAGAHVDLSGGGDLYAYEFIAGQGGSSDVLDPHNLPASAHPPGTTIYSYAIIPTLGSQFAPLDPQYSQGSSVAANKTIYLSGVPGLAAGTYALLPARYATLPGAFAIQVIAANNGTAPATAVLQPDGSYIAAARFGTAGTGALDSLSSSVLVAPSSVVHGQSQYTDSFANAFFSGAAAATGKSTGALPADAGELLLSVSDRLNLLGSIDFNVGQYAYGKDAKGAPLTRDGRAGDVAILAHDLAVVDTLSGAGAPGTVELDVQQLNQLRAQTLILGASSSTTAAGQELSIGDTQTVDLRNSIALTAPEILVAARDSVTVEAGSKLIAQGGAAANGEGVSHLLLPGGGALLRISSSTDATLSVDGGTTPSTGSVTIGSGATVQSSGSLLLYGTQDTVIAPGALVSAPDVALYASRVSMGNAPSGTAGLVIDSSLLSRLSGLTDLTIGSSSSIDFYDSVQIGSTSAGAPLLRSVNFDAPVIAGFGAGAKTVQAGTIGWFNSSPSSSGPVGLGDGTGALTLIAKGSQAAPGQITLGSGDRVLSGFSAFNLHADGNVVGQGSGTLTASSASGAVAVDIIAAALSGESGSTQSWSTTGKVTIGTSKTRSTTFAGLGAALSIQGLSIDDNGSINLPSGNLSLHATGGDVHLGSAARILAGGFIADFAGTESATGGGRVTLASDTGSVMLDAGANVDVAGVTGSSTAGNAGSLAVSASHGSFVFGANVIHGDAASDATAGSFSLDVDSGLAGSGLASLDQLLAQGGFHGTIAIRSRNDAQLKLHDSIRASRFELAADHGSIDIGSNAVIDTRGTERSVDGGAISIWAGTDLLVEAGATLRADGAAHGPMGANGQSLATRGGDIVLGAATGTITLTGGSAAKPTLFSMRGSDASTDGELELRALRSADGSIVQVAVQNPSGIAVRSARPVVIEGVRSYLATSLGASDAGCGSGGSCDIADLNGVLATDAAAFATHATDIATALGLSNVSVRPGVEIDSAADLLVGDTGASPWDLGAWNAALGAPVNVTLRAAGNLAIRASISDGFTSNGGSPESWAFGEPSANGYSASYRVAAGADLTAADPLAVTAQRLTAPSLGQPPDSGNVLLAPGTFVRTGTGTIDVAAGGDVLLGYSFDGYDAGNHLLATETAPLTAAIYTAGSPSALSDAQSALFTPSNLSRSGGGTPAYPTGGGNIRVAALGDIRSAPSAQMVSDWLWRRGPLDGTYSPRTNTSWWVMFDRFRQGIGALGGGGLTLIAGRDILNTSAVIPTTGRLLTASGATPTLSDLLLTGGGQLQVDAGGDIISGVFENDWGDSFLNAGGAITSGPHSTFGQMYPGAQSSTPLPDASTQVYSMFVVGNGEFNATARTKIEFAGVSNSTTLPITVANAAAVLSSGTNASFFAYAPTGQPSTLSIMSAGGDVTLQAQPLQTLPIVALAGGNVYDGSAAPNDYLSLYPSNVRVVSASGNIDLGSAHGNSLLPYSVALTLYPAANGNLELLAAKSVNNDGNPATIVVSEADPARVPSPYAPADGINFAGLAGVGLPQSPLHIADDQSISIVAAAGDIAPMLLIVPKPASIVAGGNIVDLDFSGKNLRPTDVTSIFAGGDISYTTPVAPVTNALLANGAGIQLAGPGQLEVLAGGSINLGDSTGLVTTGSLSDARLDATGASMVVGAGFGTYQGKLRPPDYASFIAKYLDKDATSGEASAYAVDLIEYMRQFNPLAGANLGYEAALAAFKALPPAKQLPLVAHVLSDELSFVGLEHSKTGAPYDRGYAAIATLFPVKDSAGNAIARNGDISMFFSQLKTEQGGDISLLAPGGSVIVGVPNPPASLAAVKAFTTPIGLTVPAEVNLGILVLGRGAVRGFADQNFEVNQSRILTLEGGDIVLWASNGNIDAGKGAKSASGAPPPVIQTDSNGNLFVDPSNAVSGSGIGQLLTSPNLKAGLVNLIAPKGAVDAGDAGIRVAGNLNIAALQVIGAANITVVGTSSGVPTSDAGSLSGALSGANSLGDASKSAVDQLGQGLANAGNLQQLTDELAPVFINVKFFCLGVQCDQQ
jgi:filamentous hemagglutinin